MIVIVNENDMVAIDELKFGDNDILLVLVVSLVEVDWLFLFIDVDCFYFSDFCLDFDVYFIFLVKVVELV